MKRLFEPIAGSWGSYLRIDQVLCDVASSIGRILVFENEDCGRVLAIDGQVQLSTKDEHVYHEMLVHSVLGTHSYPRAVLIIGGADGGALREVLKYNVQSVTLVEISPDALDVCRRHLPMVAGSAFEDPRVEVVIGDGSQYILQTDRKFDAVIVDGTDDHGVSSSLYQAAFYRACYNSLEPGGAMSSHLSGSFLEGREVLKRDAVLRTVFPVRALVDVPVRCFPGCSVVVVAAFKSSGAQFKRPGSLPPTRYFSFRLFELECLASEERWKIAAQRGL